MTEQALTRYEFTIDGAVAEWLADALRRSGSEKTLRAYRETMAAFRAAIATEGLDLLSPPIDVARLAAAWAGGRNENARANRRDAPVAAATYNQRLAVLSSWYSFVNRHYHLEVLNPLDDIKRRTVQAYATSRYIESEEIEESLDDINRRGLLGLRDYAIIAVGLATGRRASEIVGLRGRDVAITPARRGRPELVTLTFHCKGDKIKRDQLDPDNSAVFLEYLHAQHGRELLRLPPEAAIWVSYSRRNAGEAMSYKTLANICKDRLGRNAHALRHTFTHEMIESGAPITTTSERLGHSDIKITQRYGRSLTGDKNPFAEKLSARFGIKPSGRRP